MKLSVSFVPGDLWVGAFVKRIDFNPYYVRWHVYVCIIPTLPIHVQWNRQYPNPYHDLDKDAIAEIEAVPSSYDAARTVDEEPQP